LPALPDFIEVEGDIVTPGTVGELVPLEFFPDFKDPELDPLDFEGTELNPPDLDPLPLLTVGALVVMSMVENMTSDAVLTQSSISSSGHGTMMSASPTAINSSTEPACKYLLVATLPISKMVDSPMFTSVSSSGVRVATPK
jgi:hypothetical protein